MAILYADTINKFINDNFEERMILYTVLVILWKIFLWETYLLFRQSKVVRDNPTIPSELIGLMDQETYTKARNYHKDKNRFSFFSNTYDQIITTVILLVYGIPYLWNFSGTLTNKLGYDNELIQTCTFLFVGSLITTIHELPWSIYHTFVLEAKHGFNKQTPSFYAKDKIKKFIVSQALLLPIVSGLVMIVKIGGEYFFIGLWGFSVLVTLILLTIYADYIAPLFDKFTNLPEGALKDDIENLANKIGFPLKKIYVVEGSKRSAHSNAYFYGFYKNKRVVLFDTLLEDFKVADQEEKAELVEEEESKESSEEKSKTKLGCSNEEVLAILGHEFGHWKLNHLLKNLLASQINLFLSFMVFAILFKNQLIYRAFGFTTQPVIIGFIIIFQFIFSPYNELLSFFMSVMSRRFEFAADAFAKGLNMASYLRSGLIKLNKDNLGFPVFDKLYSAWHHSHPPVFERIKALGKLD